MRSTTEDRRFMTTFYYCSVNHHSGLQRYTFSKLSYIFFNTYIKMCRKLCHFIWGIWWFHRSKDFEAMKAGKLPIWPWLSCQYNENTLVDLPSSVGIDIISTWNKNCFLTNNVGHVYFPFRKYFFEKKI